MSVTGRTQKTRKLRHRRRNRAYLPAAERRKSIIAAAQKVFAHCNFQGTRTRDIAKAAAINSATLKAAATPAELAQLAQASTARHLQDTVEMFPLFCVALFSDPKLGRKLYRNHLVPLIRQRGEVLRLLVKSGIDPEFVGLANFGVLFAVAMDRAFSGTKDKLSVVAGQFNRLSTQGFARDTPNPTLRADSVTIE